MDDLLPIAAPAWRSLRALTLGGTGFREFPLGLAGALFRLTHFNLAGNNFACFPIAVKDVDTLAALPHLQSLNISKVCKFSHVKVEDWTERSVVALIASTKRFPLLKLRHWTEG